jgi:catechol-2,3-dioxygenase
MPAIEPDRVVDDYLAGRMSRRQMVARLMALGAAAAGAGRVARAAQDAPTFQAVSVDHIALSVTDLDRSRAWYEKHLGLTTTSQDDSSVFMDAGNDFVALFRSDTPGLDHYSFGIRNYDQQENARRLRAAGLEPKLRGNRTYFDDPDGIEVQVSGV